MSSEPAGIPDELTPELLVSAYTQGIFPMGDPDGEVYWYSPDPRAIIDLDRFHAPRTLRQICRQERFELAINRDFVGVLDACADRAEGTWIVPALRAAVIGLYERGYAHSVEAWQDGQLAGGLYGVSIGGAFFGESMFHRVSHASKVALVYLVERMRVGGFTLLDIQFATDHLERFGATTVPRRTYLRMLDEALERTAQLSA